MWWHAAAGVIGRAHHWPGGCMFGLLLAALLFPAQSEPAAPPTVAVFPVETQQDARVGANTGRMLARVLSSHLGTESNWQVVSLDDLEVLLQQTRDAQAVGCANEACRTEVGGALGASLLVTGRLNVLQQTYYWEAGVVDLQGRSIRRATLKGHSVEVLAARANDLALMLLGKAPQQLLETRGASKRLGFKDKKDFKEFKDAYARQPETNLADALTDHILVKNGEDPRLAVAEALTLGGSLAAVWTAGFLLLGASFLLGGGPPGLVLASIMGVTGCLLLPAALVLAGVGVTLSAVDLANLGRVAVKRKGCCRNDARLARAEKPNRLERGWATVLGLAGPMTFAVAVSSPLVALAAALAGVITFSPLPLPDSPSALFNVAFPAVGGLAVCLPACTCVVAPLVGLGGLMLALGPGPDLLDGASAKPTADLEEP